MAQSNWQYSIIYVDTEGNEKLRSTASYQLIELFCGFWCGFFDSEKKESFQLQLAKKSQ